MDPSFSIKSPAKVNLGLKILNKRPDNFHNILSIFIELDLYDILDFIPSKSFSIVSKGYYKVPTGNSNFIFKAVEIFSQQFGISVDYKIFQLEQD